MDCMQLIEIFSLELSGVEHLAEITGDE